MTLHVDSYDAEKFFFTTSTLLKDFLKEKKISLSKACNTNNAFIYYFLSFLDAVDR